MHPSKQIKIYEVRYYLKNGDVVTQQTRYYKGAVYKIGECLNNNPIIKIEEIEELL